MLSNLLNIPATLIRLVNIKEIGKFALYCFTMATQGHWGDPANGEEQEVWRGFKQTSRLLGANAGVFSGVWRPCEERDRWTDRQEPMQHFSNTAEMWLSIQKKNIHTHRGKHFWTPPTTSQRSLYNYSLSSSVWETVAAWSCPPIND